MALPPPFSIRVVSLRSLAPAVCELVLERCDSEPIRFEPGQWINLLVPVDGELVKRSYSIASAPRSDGRIELAITRVDGGIASPKLHELAPGSVLEASGPMGFFTRSAAKDAPALFVATGTGVAPIRSMIASALSAPSAPPLALLFGVRHQNDLLYRDEWDRAASASPAGFAFHPTLSKPDDQWKGDIGYVQQHVERAYRSLASLDASASRAPHVYVCGLQRMVSAVRDKLRKEMGLDRTLVHTERYDG